MGLQIDAVTFTFMSSSKAAHKPRQPALGTSDDSDSDEQTLSDEEDEDEARGAGAGAEAGDSDSEDDLQDSPRRIYQSPAVDVPQSPTDAATDAVTETPAAEKMDVDATEASKESTAHSESAMTLKVLQAL